MMSAPPAATGHREERGAQRATFILRLWREQTGTDRAGWRGVIEHVQSGERRAVADADGVAALLSGWLQALHDETT